MQAEEREREGATPTPQAESPETLQHLLFALSRRTLLRAGVSAEEVELRGIKQLQRRGLQILVGLDPEVDVELVDESDRERRIQLKLGQVHLRQHTHGRPGDVEKLDSAIPDLYGRGTIHLRKAGAASSTLDTAFSQADRARVVPFAEHRAVLSMLLELAGTSKGLLLEEEELFGLKQLSTTAVDVVKAANADQAGRQFRAEWDGQGPLQSVPQGLLDGTPQGGWLTALRPELKPPPSAPPAGSSQAPAAVAGPGSGPLLQGGGAGLALLERMAALPAVPDSLRLTFVDGGEAAEAARAAATSDARAGESAGGGIRKVVGSHANSSLIASDDNPYLLRGGDHSLFGALKRARGGVLGGAGAASGDSNLSLRLPRLDGPFDPLASLPPAIASEPDPLALQPPPHPSSHYPSSSPSSPSALPAGTPRPMGLPPIPAREEEEELGRKGGQLAGGLADPDVWRAVLGPAGAGASGAPGGAAPPRGKDWDAWHDGPVGIPSGVGIRVPGGAGGEVPERPVESRFFSESGAGAFDALYSRHFARQPLQPDEPVVPEGHLVQEALLALQGVPPAGLLEGAGAGPRGARPRLRSTGGASVASVLARLTEAGRLRARLDRFVARFCAAAAVGGGGGVGATEAGGAAAGDDGQGGMIQQAFAGAVGSVLRAHSATLHVLPARVIAARGEGGGASAPSGPAAGPAPPLASAAAAGAGGGASLLEVLVHTESLRDQVHFLAFLCRCGDAPPAEGGGGRREERTPAGEEGKALWEVSGFPGGRDLLSYVYGQLLHAEPAVEPLLRFLLNAALRPYLRQVRTWLFHGEVSDPFREFVAPPPPPAAEEEGGAGKPNLAVGLSGGAPSLADEGAALPVWGGDGGADPPDFLAAVAQPLLRAGQQLQVLRRMPVARPFVMQLAALAAEEALDAGEVAADARELSSVEGGEEAAAGLDGSAWGGALPLVFTSSALRKLADVQSRAERARAAEQARLTARMAEARRAAGEEAGRDTARKMAQASEEEEARRAERAAAAARERAVKLRLWRVQKAELSQRAAMAAAGKQAEVQLELAYARQAAIREREDLERELGLAPAEGGAGAGTGGLVEALAGREERIAWRAARIALGPQRRRLLAAQAMLEAEALRFRVTEGRAIPDELSLVITPEPPRRGVAPLAAPFGTGQDEGTEQRGVPGAVTLSNPFGTSADELRAVQERIQAITSPPPARAAPYGTDDEEVPAVEARAPTAPWATKADEGGAPAGVEHLGAKVSGPWADEATARADAEAPAGLEKRGAVVSAPYMWPEGEGAAGAAAAAPGAHVAKPFGSADDEQVRLGHEHVGRAMGSPFATTAEAGASGTPPRTPGPGPGAGAGEPKTPGTERKKWDKTPNPDPFPAAGKPSSPVGGRGAGGGGRPQPTPGGGVGGTLRFEPPSPGPTPTRVGADARGLGGEEAYHGDDSDDEVGEGAAGGGAGALGADEGAAPLPVVVDTCVARGVLAQYRCVSRATLDVLELELGLSGYLASLQRVFFMQAGDVAELFASQLCARLAAASPGAAGGSRRAPAHRPPAGGLCSDLELQAMLDSALKGSSLDGEPIAGGVRAIWAPPGPGGAPGLLSDQKVDALDPVRLKVDAPWPLSLVVTEGSLEGYADIFSALLRFKRASHALRDIWHNLQHLDKQLSRAEERAAGMRRRGEPEGEGGEEGEGGDEPGTPPRPPPGEGGGEGPRTPMRTPGPRGGGGAGASDPATPGPPPKTPAADPRGAGSPAAGVGPAARRAAQRRRLRRMQLFRHEIEHFVGIVQAYMHSQVLGDVWDRFQEARRSRVVDLEDLRAAHELYVREACRRCMLSAETRAVREIVTDSVQRVLDLRQCLRQCERPADLERADVYEALRRTHLSFRTRMQYLFRVLRSLALRGQLRGLFVQLDFNRFYEVSTAAS